MKGQIKKKNKLNPFFVQIMIGPGLKFNVNTTFIEKDQVKFK